MDGPESGRVKQPGAGVEAWLESCVVNTRLNPPLSLLGPWSHSEACGAQGDNSGTAPKEVPEMDKVNTVAVSRCNYFWNPVPVWAAPCVALYLLGISWDLCVVPFIFQMPCLHARAYRLLCFQIVTLGMFGWIKGRLVLRS